MDKGKTKRVTKKISLSGIVQGVGFRPYVSRLAEKFNIEGNVKNCGGSVEIMAQADRVNYRAFMKHIRNNSGQGYEILQLIEEDWAGEETFTGFRIDESREKNETALISPDLPICSNCMEELYREGDRRYLNPFISCMVCGARYTIIERLPYDRENTAMQDYTMCPSCSMEYKDKESRRFHAQTISCYDCGPYLIFRERNITNRKNVFKEAALETANQEALEKAVSILKAGGILAVKGIGGYHFAASPFSEEAVKNLRKLKGREEKPFAVMFPDTETMERYCFLSEEEKKLAESTARPIVLLNLKDTIDTLPMLMLAPSVNKDSIYCGAFLPYTPLQVLLINACGPLIMTSANISGKPIIRSEDVIFSIESPYLKGILYNTRRIVRSVDDSVAKIIDNTPQIIRRSRGYVPYPIFINSNQKRQILAMGGDLKAAFCLYKDGKGFVSQYFGDLEEQAVMEEYIGSVKDLSHLLKIQPDLVVCDLHPGYLGTRYANNLSLPIYEIQHHHAHVASVMAEYNLRGPVIGVAFDGTGYGTDGNIWGSEFLICRDSEFIRTAHLKYMNILGGDSSMKDGKKTAACYLIQMGLKENIHEERLAIIESALLNKCNTVLTSSMGRLFDSVAAVLEIQDFNHYEGQCAANLEKAAVFAIRKNKKPIPLAFCISEKDNKLEIDMEPVLKRICSLKETADEEALALGFHYAVSDMVLEVCERIRLRDKINEVALCGGVFQNTVLMERTLKLLREKEFKVYYNKSLPPNDGSISLGQVYLALMKEQKGDL